MVIYCKDNKCLDLIKEIYENVNKQIQKGWYDHYTNKEIHDIPKHIREEFNSLYRDIQLSQILK